MRRGDGDYEVEQVYSVGGDYIKLELCALYFVLCIYGLVKRTKDKVQSTKLTEG